MICHTKCTNWYTVIWLQNHTICQYGILWFWCRITHNMPKWHTVILVQNHNPIVWLEFLTAIIPHMIPTILPPAYLQPFFFESYSNGNNTGPTATPYFPVNIWGLFVGFIMSFVIVLSVLLVILRAHIWSQRRHTRVVSLYRWRTRL